MWTTVRDDFVRSKTRLNLTEAYRGNFLGDRATNLDWIISLDKHGKPRSHLTNYCTRYGCFTARLRLRFERACAYYTSSTESSREMTVEWRGRRRWRPWRSRIITTMYDFLRVRCARNHLRHANKHAAAEAHFQSPPNSGVVTATANPGPRPLEESQPLTTASDVLQGVYSMTHLAPLGFGCFYLFPNNLCRFCLSSRYRLVPRKEGVDWIAISEVSCLISVLVFIYLFAPKSTIIIAIKYVKQGRSARLSTRALTAALKTTNSNINASSELKLELKS